MAQYFIFAVQDLINFSNGQPFFGVQIGATNHAGTSAAVNQNETQALNAVVSAGYSIAFVRGYGPMAEYILTK